MLAQDPGLRCEGEAVRAPTLPCACTTPPLIVLPPALEGWRHDICRTCHVVGPAYSERWPGVFWSRRTMRHVTMREFVAEGLRYTQPVGAGGG
jgi:hypothetical protein